MTEKQKRDQIASMLLAMGEIYGKEVSAIRIKFYLDILIPYPLEKIEAAARHILQTRKYTNFPMPADFLDYLNPPVETEIKANRAWQLVLETIDRYGYTTTVRFTDPAITHTIRAMGSGWSDFCNRTRCNDEDFRWLQKEFERRYAGYAKLPKLRNEILIGWCDAQNEERNPKPVLIGQSTEKQLLTASKRGNGKNGV